MKKTFVPSMVPFLMLLLALLLICVLPLLSGALAEQNPSGSPNVAAVEPLPADPVQPDLLTGAFEVSIANMDRFDRDHALTFILYEKDRYAAEQIHALKPGDTVRVSGKIFTVKDLSVRDGNGSAEAPEPRVYELEALEESWDGIYFLESDGFCFANVGDWTALSPVGSVTVPLPLSASFVYYDYPGGEDPVPSSASDFLSDLRECAPAFFAPYNTRALFRDGVLLELHSWSYPWGPDADPAEPAP